MRTNKKRILGGVAFVGVAALSFHIVDFPTNAADHLDPPQRTSPDVAAMADRAADIADVFTFFDGDTTKLIVTFAGPVPSDTAPTFDPNVRYYLNVSTGEPRTTSDTRILIQFGEDETQMGDQYGVRVSGLPGVTGDIIGPVETDLEQEGVKVRAGLFDDPFFFDLQGFQETLDTGTLSFDSSRDFFAGQNLTAVVIEIPNADISGGSNSIDVWTETLRLGGTS
ncbi:DUF4331 family protein [Sphingomicrobium sediminis]|uniref:DUF4331 domain-containing protein n=1 Tax=Sphingomicrobium sediminis TaxID=2950949 RepID=A0A9X2EJB9_9SPHN|nr:DUF4331 family protein [Sphingomicrobium sediminis]MCM8556654.1 DUF4331 domain-containing protein [Sphingomicrobium sediminis]